MAQKLTHEDPRALHLHQSRSVRSRIKLADVVHGRIEHDGALATLIVIEATFEIPPERTGDRIQGAQIKLTFEAKNGTAARSDPEVFKIAPDGRCFYDPTHISEDISPPDGHIGTGITLLGMVQATNYNREKPKSAVWQISEAANKQGIPPTLRAALLIRRTTQDCFQMTARVRLELSGLASFRSPMDNRSQRFGAMDEPVVFNPGIRASSIDGVEPERLGEIELMSLKLGLLLNTQRHMPETDTSVSILVPSKSESQSDANFLAQIDSVAEGAREEVEHRMSDQIFDIKGFYAKIWGAAESLTPSELKLQEWPQKSLSEALLNGYFPWVRRKDPFLSSGGGIAGDKHQPTQEPVFFMLGRKSQDIAGCRNLEDLNMMLDEDSASSIINFFRLPRDFLVLRRNDAGLCQCNRREDGRSLAYLSQTPFYDSGFWSVALVIDDEPTRAACILQCDRTIDISGIRRKIQNCTGAYRHPLQLLLKLFENHVMTTSDKFDDLYRNIQEVDFKLLHQLSEATNPKNRDKGSRYSELGLSLHTARMKLVDLMRRRQFESEMGKVLLRDLENTRLIEEANLYMGLSQMREHGLANLPRRIDSLTTVLYSLIAQHDAAVQYHLAHESIRHSMSMKTLSVITILFLPGAFVASIFSTNMFVFDPNGQEIWIYFTTVVPLTAVCMVVWRWWLREPLVSVEDGIHADEIKASR
ncbi:hypothetical protein F5Y04DRAFT_80172 [Hypomontagnella monticulosa]|nr:hypothetical protein F5Y04DRAFT_80172 [Hypomontagnella monticulosa]